jgi:hypothetical protein
MPTNRSGLNILDQQHCLDIRKKKTYYRVPCRISRRRRGGWEQLWSAEQQTCIKIVSIFAFKSDKNNLCLLFLWDKITSILEQLFKLLVSCWPVL